MPLSVNAQKKENMGLFDFVTNKEGGEERIQRILSDNLITPAMISAHLAEVCKQNTHVKINIDDHPLEFSSTLVEVTKSGAEGILIDSLMPRVGNRYITDSKSLKFTYSYGNNFMFRSTYIATIKEKFTLIKISIPSIIKITQRRSAYRVSPSLNEPMTIVLKDGVPDRIIDLSQGGLAFATAINKIELPLGMLLEGITFTLPNNNSIKVTAEVRWFHENIFPSPKAKHKCCLKFIEIKDSDVDIIAKYVMQREMEIIRKFKGEYE